MIGVPFGKRDGFVFRGRIRAGARHGPREEARERHIRNARHDRSAIGSKLSSLAALHA